MKELELTERVRRAREWVWGDRDRHWCEQASFKGQC
jgi:hypothetical protein